MNAHDPRHERRRETDRYPPRNAALRVVLCADTLIVTITAMLADQPRSLIGRLLDASGPLAWGLFVVLACAAVLGLLDLLVNDVLDERWSFPWASKHRHIGYLAIAAFNLIFIFVVASRGSIGFAIARFLLDVCVAVWIAIFDVKHRYIEPRKRDTDWSKLCEH